MLLDDVIKRNIHLFTILQKSHMQAVMEWASEPYGVISAPYHPQLSDSLLFDVLCADANLKLFDCDTYKKPILMDAPHHINFFIFQGKESPQLQQFATNKGYKTLSKRPPALIFSPESNDWQRQIQNWQQQQQNGIILADYINH